MAEPYVGEIRMIAANFPPEGWAFCDGQLVSVSSNDALFSLLGTIYGGDGETTFGLPDLRGRVPIHFGNVTGLTPVSQGQKAGQEKETLTVNQLPSHRHDFACTSGTATTASPANAIPATGSLASYVNAAPGGQNLANEVVNAGGSQSHSNLMPYLCIHFIIALYGVYPSEQ